MLKIYNSLTQQKEQFIPLVPGKIGIYVCGITVYDHCHLGHARVFVGFDVIYRFLKAMGWQVKYVRNITDIDDKIIQRANENHEPYEELTQRFIHFMNEDLKALNTLLPDEQPRATAHIPEIIDMIQRLVKNQLAYVGENGDVYFAVDAFESYGALSGRSLDAMMSGARVQVNEAKRNPLDFVLWKKAKENEPSFPSPFGPGRPGWHIECSAMSTCCLGDSFDIHGGGADLLFPHHENERAQAQGATKKEFARTWMHMGFVQVDKEKMSKSLNNFFTIKEILAQYDPEVVRYFLIASHYRSPVNYSLEQLDKAKKALDRIYSALRGVTQQQEQKLGPRSEHPLEKRFIEAMHDDFNTPEALAVVFEAVKALNIAKEEQNLEQASHLASRVKSFCQILGVGQEDPQAYFQKGEDLTTIEGLIEKRNQARRDKDWAKADEARDQLKAMGISLEDSPNGTLWKRDQSQ